MLHEIIELFISFTLHFMIMLFKIYVYLIGYIKKFVETEYFNCNNEKEWKTCASW